MTFSRWTFRLAGFYGLLALLPFYFREASFGRDFPPAVAHPEFYYGFVGVAVVWQVVFFLIGSDPVRFRPLMAAAVLEKLAFGVPALILHFQGRIPPPLLAGGVIDLGLAVLFIAAFFSVKNSAS